MYAIIDVETTGLSSKNEKITEIAIIIHDGKKIIDEFSSLINPEKLIPYKITMLTGINNKMIAEAPKFHEIAKKIIELTEGKIIVGHNVAFDYSFIKNEYAQLFYEFKRKTLCTVKLSRKLLPGYRSYSLGNLCKSLNIKNNSIHRAYGDAKATAEVFEILYEIDNKLSEIPLRGLNTNFNKKILDELPEKPGVYYFFNEDKKLIYIGKSKNIHSRVLSHLSNNSTKKAVEMKTNIADIDFEITGSELVALLKESDEIKEHKPVYNRSQRRSVFPYGLFSNYNKDGYLCLAIEKVEDNIPLTSFSSALEGKERLFRLTEEYSLCQKFCSLYKTQSCCFQYQINRCMGACIGKEKPEDYNKKVKLAIAAYIFENESFFIIDEGRNNYEKSVIKVENGKYIGYGFCDSETLNSNLEILHDCIKQYKNNRDVQQILKSYLKRKRVEQIISF
ncbi:MAG: GIY-YIG nuclease family protein [Bacteroidales bacterium]|nr:GIY-YIG nuclease family protein [Bacteroidales bacterium]